MAEYFSHDYDSREDEKIIDMMGEMGWAGYGLFWGIVELLYKNGGKMRTNYNRIAFALNSHPDSIQQVIENYGLFKVSKGFFYSPSVKKRLMKRNEKSEVARANARKRWENNNANALPSQSKRNAKNERKGNKIKDNIDIPPFEVFKKYAIEKKPLVDPAALKLKYEAWIEEGWKDGNGRPIKNWKSKVLNTLPYIDEKKGVAGSNLGGDPLPDDYGQPSETAITREEYLKSKKDKS